MPYVALTFAAMAALASIWMHAHWLAALAGVLAVVALAFIDLRSVFVLAYPIVALLGALISSAVIEDGAYIREQLRAGFNIGATPWLALYAIGFLAIAHLSITWFTKRGKPVDLPPRLFAWSVAALSVGVSLFYVGIFAMYGLGLSFSTRLDWLGSLPGFLQTGHSLIRSYVIPVTFTLAGIAWFAFGVRRHWPLMLTTALPVIALAGTGEKFSGFSTIICMTLAGIGLGAILTGKSIRFRKWHFVTAGVIIAALAVALVAGYQRMGAVSIWTAVTERIALQGHVWFGVFDQLKGEPGVNLAELLRKNEHDTPAGLDLLSYLVADHNFVYERIGRGYSFTMGGPAGPLAAFGAPAGLILYSMLGLLYTATIVLTLVFIRSGVALLAVAPLVLYVLVGAATQMGYWDAMYGSVAIGAYLLCIVGAALIWRRGWLERIALRPAAAESVTPTR